LDTHIIRLRGPWERDAVAVNRMRCTRRFGLPTNLGPAEQVWVVVERCNSSGAATLNGARLGTIAPNAGKIEFDVTQLLAARNVLEIEIELPPDEPVAARPDSSGRQQSPARPIGEVRLEIRS
jgi:hypothetical protein